VLGQPEAQRDVLGVPQRGLATFLPLRSCGPRAVRATSSAPPEAEPAMTFKAPLERTKALMAGPLPT
jgi:hypothetical protein